MITAKVIADSISERGVRLTTMEIEYPRFILSEINTHRLFSRNSSSSRAIPVQKMHQHVLNNPVKPIHWGSNRPGMQAGAEVQGVTRQLVEKFWFDSRHMAMLFSEALSELGLHKQVANRLIEPWVLQKTVISATEWANFYALRCHEAAQPEIHELALKMHEAQRCSIPQLLKPGQWHLPYITTTVGDGIKYLDESGEELSLEDARIISASCCAQVSYRSSNQTIEKARDIYKTLIESKPAHASPVEHQATPMSDADREGWGSGVSHRDKKHYWSGNFREWIQFRKLIEGEAVWDT